MKNIKKLFMILLIVISLLFIVNVSADTSKVEITNITVKDKSGTITVVDPTFESNEITSNITFTQKDDFVTFELTLKNSDSTNKYKVGSIDDNNTNNNISIEYGYSDDYISKNETTKLTITLKYNNQLINIDNINLDNLTININLVSENGDSSSVIINPKTGDHLIFYFVLLTISIIGLVLIVTKKKKNDLKIGILLLAFAIVMVPFVTFAFEPLEISIKFSSIDIKGKFETYNITIDSKDGSEQIVKSITYGQPIGELPNNPTKDGYDFEKWVDQNGNQITSETIITGPIDIIAKYNIIDYSIVYDLDDGSLEEGKNNPTSYNVESDSITLENPSKKGYTFTGWTGTGLTGLSTTVTIPSGSIENRNYVANYSANENTKYTVIHKYQNYDLTSYTEDKEVLTGKTDTSVTPTFKSVYGFNDPESTQTINVDGDEKAEVTYIYTRKNFNFEITDRTYIDEDVTTANNSYLYETSITIKAVDRPGYSFEWSDGDKNLERTFDLTDNTSLSTVYTPNTNTKYRVEHYKMKFAEGDYELAAYQNLEGTTDAPITPTVNEYEGFTSPAAQSTTIAGTGDRVVKYYYNRKQVNVTVNNPENVVEGNVSGKYYYDQEITLTAKEIENHKFYKWSNDETTNSLTIKIGLNDIEIGPIYIENNQVIVSFDTDEGTGVESQVVNIGGKATRPETDPTKEGYKFRNWYADEKHLTLFDFNNTTITEDTTIYALFIEDVFTTIFSQSDECIFNGKDGVIEGENCAYANGTNKYIDTGVKLYGEENHEKDYEIGFTIESYDKVNQVAQATFMNTKLEGDSFPGLVFRIKNSEFSRLDFSSNYNIKENERRYFDSNDVHQVKIYRIYNEETKVQEIFYKIDDGKRIKMNDLSKHNPIFELNVWFGAAPANVSASQAQRHLVGTLKDIYIKVGIFKEN